MGEEVGELIEIRAGEFLLNLEGNGREGSTYFAGVGEGENARDFMKRTDQIISTFQVGSELFK